MKEWISFADLETRTHSLNFLCGVWVMWCWLIGGCPVLSSSFMYHHLIFRGSEQVEFFGKIRCSSLEYPGLST